MATSDKRLRKVSTGIALLVAANVLLMLLVAGFVLLTMSGFLGLGILTERVIILFRSPGSSRLRDTNAAMDRRAMSLSCDPARGEGDRLPTDFNSADGGQLRHGAATPIRSGSACAQRGIVLVTDRIHLLFAAVHRPPDELLRTT